jgi:OOP family OmpA-OmpF porin
MKKPTRILHRCTIGAIAIVISVSLIGCAHEIKAIKSVPPVPPVAFSANATSVEEMAIQTEMTANAYVNQVDVLAPVHFDESKVYFDKANQENNKGASSATILKTLGLARAHLNKAIQDAKVTQTMVSEISNARLQALNAGARKNFAGLNILDNQFKKITTEAIKGNTKFETTALQNQYLALELSSIKTAKLQNLQDMLTEAKAKNAPKIVPQAYSSLVQKYNIAEKVIETDRHSNPKIDSAVAEATLAAKRTLKLLVSEQNSRSQTPEQRAVTLESRDNALQAADSTISEVAAVAIQKNEELQVRNASLILSEKENKEHKRIELDNKIVADAAALFSNNESDVYRQEGLLIIRLKTMNFASGRSDLPADALAILNKVKEVLVDLGPSQVMVQGHTDGIGSASTNQKLSQNRAQAVQKYFSLDKILEKNQIESVGYGYTKPLASNKTKEGRAQNRRVDIVITPNQTI